ncbi:MAG: cytochrome c oxidase assembly factor 1 family protein, partial [Verrucomicrobiota bacterium]|nr:cytochrome c oxidase assembly factor 1 family protein [Verrucomicrobiota bacterium]
VEGTSGKADMTIPISGPHGSGTIYAVATKTAGRWIYSILEVEVKVRNRKDRIELPKDSSD